MTEASDATTIDAIGLGSWNRRSAVIIADAAEKIKKFGLEN